MKGWALNNEMCALGLVSCSLYLTAPSDTYVHGQERLNQERKRPANMSTSHRILIF